METEVLTAWAGRRPDERESILKVQDPEVVRLIDASMRMLWTAEMQARQFGVKGPMDPYDHAQLALLSSMEFHGGAEEDDRSLRQVKWPRQFSEDPMMVPAALQYALPPKAAGRRGPQFLPPHKWPQLMQPPAKSWMEFERQLARLVEQLVMHALRGATGAPAGAGQAAASSGNGRSGNGFANHGQQDDDSDGEDDGGTSAPMGARAQKRARQRERRRMGRALARQDGDGPAPAGDRAGVLGACSTSPLMDAGEPPMGGAFAGGSPVLRGVPAVVIPASVPLSTPALAVGHEGEAEVMKVRTDSSHSAPGAGRSPELGPIGKALGLDYGGPRSSHASPLLGSSHASPLLAAGDLAEEALGLRLQASGPAAADPVAGNLVDVDSDEDEPPIVLAGFSAGAASRGVGRGRPMGSQDPSGPVIGLRGRGMGVGRGRALDPPPGLQSLGLQSQQPVLSSLSRSWMPGPTIAEEEGEDDTVTPVESPIPAWRRWPDFELPQGALIGLGEAVESSYASSPRHDWGATPSAYSPAESPALRPGHAPFDIPGLGSVHQGAQEGVEGRGRGRERERGRTGSQHSGDPGDISPLPASLQPAVIPMYVTVPLAMTHSCPHCGHSFALPPGGFESMGPAIGVA